MRLKKSSLNLSVNAIVVFVLAFAMLGVGLFVTDLIRRSIEDPIEGAFDESDFQELPTASRQLTFTSPNIKLSLNGQLKLGVAYYHKDDPTTNARPGLMECTKGEYDYNAVNGDTTGYGFIDALKFETVGEEINTGEFKIFSVLIENDAIETGALGNTKFKTGSYICKFCIYEDSNGRISSYNDLQTTPDGKLTRVFDPVTQRIDKSDPNADKIYYCEQKNIEIMP